MAEPATQYPCACGFTGTLDEVIKHVSHKVNVDKDTCYYADGGHAVMLRAMREGAGKSTGAESC